jgi:hypothetical protein
MSIELLAIILGFLATVTKAVLDMRRLKAQVAHIQGGLDSVHAQVSNHIPTTLHYIQSRIAELPCVKTAPYKQQ